MDAANTYLRKSSNSLDLPNNKPQATSRFSQSEEAVQSSMVQVASSVGASLSKAFRRSNTGMVPFTLVAGTAGLVTGGVSSALTAVAAASNLVPTVIATASLAEDAGLFGSRKIEEHHNSVSSENPEIPVPQDALDNTEVPAAELASSNHLSERTTFSFGSHVVELSNHASHYAAVSSIGATAFVAVGKATAVFVGGAWVAGFAGGIASFYLIKPYFEKTKNISSAEETHNAEQPLITDGSEASQEKSETDTILETPKENASHSLSVSQESIKIRQEKAYQAHLQRQQASRHKKNS